MERRMRATTVVRGLVSRSVSMSMVLLSACGSDDGRTTASGSGVVTVGVSASASASGSATGMPTGGSDGATQTPDGSAEGPFFDVGSMTSTSGPGEDCVPSDVLVVLDRSQSMHRTPAGDTPPNDMAGYMSSRWWIALEALDALWLQYDGGIALGLEMFPAPAAQCVTLAERIGGMGAGNNGCGSSELVFEPALSTMGQLEAALDPLTTVLCNETPIAAAIRDAEPVLQALAGPDHDQYAVLLTDGGESCDGDFTTRVQQLVANTGARVYVVAFGDTALTNAHNGLNRMACAGQTAVGFPAPCVDDGMGNYDAADPGGPALYIPAEDAMALSDAFAEIGGALCCGAACPEG